MSSPVSLFKAAAVVVDPKSGKAPRRGPYPEVCSPRANLPHVATTPTTNKSRHEMPGRAIPKPPPAGEGSLCAERTVWFWLFSMAGPVVCQAPSSWLPTFYPRPLLSAND